jgi:hypothetical protein
VGSVVPSAAGYAELPTLVLDGRNRVDVVAIRVARIPVVDVALVFEANAIARERNKFLLIRNNNSNYGCMIAKKKSAKGGDGAQAKREQVNKDVNYCCFHK